MAKLLYRPLGLIFSTLGGIIAGIVFKQLWKQISQEEEAPKATAARYGWGEILPAAALQGAVFGFVKAAVDRGGARAFQRLTPGD